MTDTISRQLAEGETMGLQGGGRDLTTPLMVRVMAIILGIGWLFAFVHWIIDSQ